MSSEEPCITCGEPLSAHLGDCEEAVQQRQRCAQAARREASRSEVPQLGTGDFSIGSSFWPGISKLIEEAGEVLQTCGKIIASRGVIEHWDGSNLRTCLQDEIADVIAACSFVVDKNSLDHDAVEARVRRKLDRFERWHNLPGGNDPEQQRCPRCGGLVDAHDGCFRCKRNDSVLGTIEHDEIAEDAVAEHVTEMFGRHHRECPLCTDDVLCPTGSELRILMIEANDGTDLDGSDVAPSAIDTAWAKLRSEARFPTIPTWEQLDERATADRIVLKRSIDSADVQLVPRNSLAGAPFLVFRRVDLAEPEADEILRRCVDGALKAIKEME